MLKNPGFENGLEGWSHEGQVEISTTSPISGKSSVRLGPGLGSIWQRYDVQGLRILWLGATLRPKGLDVEGRIRLQCFDSRNRLLMDLEAKADPKKDAAIYTKTQALTSYIIVRIEKTGGNGELEVDDIDLKDDDRDKAQHPPQGDLAQWMKPIWKGSNVLDESVLLLSSNGKTPTGKLLFAPTKVRSVESPEHGQVFLEGKDFVVKGNEIQAISGSPILTMKDSEFVKGEFPWTNLAGRHVFVTYDHSDEWRGPVPEPQALRLPETARRLKSKKRVVIVALGDSITLGINVSSFRNVPPYMPTWVDLFANEIGRLNQNPNVKLYNVGLGGETSEWGKEMASDAVASLNPNLVLIAFGMNDFWSIPPATFRQNIEATMATVRGRSPKAEFILISSIRFDPNYTHEATYVNNFFGYQSELKALAGHGVALLDMTELSGGLYQAKSAADLETDPMHPDDFLARLYAQGLVAVLAGKP